MHRLLLAALVAGLALAAPAAAAALPKVLTQARPAFQARPGIISYTGDGTAVVGGLDGTSVRHLGHLQWMTYNRHQGLATGLLWLNDCTPDCADGAYTPHRVSVHVFSPKHGRFRRLTLSYRDHGRQRTDRRVIHFYRSLNGGTGTWAYAIAR